MADPPPSNTADDHSALLDQLQRQVNLVLEQTGRVFAAINSSPNERPTAQLLRLKSVLPTASNRFHHALDELENGLQTASLVMRRDLALYRERAGVQPEQSASKSIPLSNGTSVTAIAEASSPKPATDVSMPVLATPAVAVPPADEDIAMDDWVDSSKDDMPVPTAEPESKPAVIATSIPESSAPLADTKPSIAAHTLLTTGDINISDFALQIDTKQPPTETTAADEKTSADEKAPDTANDLDSLFNDPISAGGEQNEFGYDQHDSGDVDFGTFGGSFDANADNDNISSLLPGLEDYANTQPNAGADMDFNSLFAVGADQHDDAMNQQGAGEQRDTTFDDLLDFADMEGIEGDPNVDNTATADFDFDALFN